MAAGRSRAKNETAERTAHAWEFDEADSWEPVVPDTWELPADRQESEPTDSPGISAGWSDAARSEDEWVDAARHAGAAEPEQVATQQSPSPQTASPAVNATADAGRVPYLEAVAAQYLGDEPVPTRPPRPPATAAPEPAAPEAAGPEAEPRGPSAVRLALGLATMAAQRLRGGVPAGDGFVTGVGLAQETALGLRELGRRVLGPASRVAAGTVKGAAMLPVAGMPVRAALRVQDRLASAVSDARARGQETIEAGRADADRVLRDRLNRGMQWATDRAVIPIVDQLAPRMAEHIVPRILAEVANGRLRAHNGPGHNGPGHNGQGRNGQGPNGDASEGSRR